MTNQTTSNADVLANRLSGEPFENVYKRVENERHARLDVVLNTRDHVRITNEPDEGVLVHVARPNSSEVARYGVTQHAERQIAGAAGIPVKYWDRMRVDAPQLLVENVRTWWRDEPANRLARIIDPARSGADETIVGEPRLRAWLSDQYRVVDNYDFMLAALDAAREFGAGIHTSHVDDDRLYVKVVTPKTYEIDAKVGDVVQMGAVFQNSEVGDGAVHVKPFLYRLRCKNGMVGASNYRAVHLGATQDVGILSASTLATEAEAIFAKIRDWSRFVLDPENAGEVVARFAATKDVLLEASPRLAIANVARRYNLSQRQADSVFEHFLRDSGHDGEDSQFSLVNAVTRAAHQTSGLSYRAGTEMEEIGGALVEMDAKAFTTLTSSRLSEKQIASAFASVE